MSGDGKRGAAHWPQATAPIFDSTTAANHGWTRPVDSRMSISAFRPQTHHQGADRRSCSRVATSKLFDFFVG
jgi:hypothetical protein